MLWKDVSKEEKNAVKEWSMCQTGILRAYRKGELNGLQYRSCKKKLAELLDRIEEYYAGSYTD